MTVFAQIARAQPFAMVTLALLSQVPVCHAARAAYGAGVELDYTDNSTLSANAEISELITTTVLSASVEDSAGRLQLDARTSVELEQYSKNTFDDQEYFNMDANLSWRAFEERLVWTAQNLYSQQRIDTFDPVRPDNIQNTNAFTTGFTVTLPVADRHGIIVIPEYRQAYYEISAADNRQNSLTVAWQYNLSPTTQLSLNTVASNVDYKAAVPGQDFLTYGLRLSVQRARSQYGLGLGQTRVKPEVGTEQTGANTSFDWSAELGRTSSLSISLASTLSESSSNLFSITSQSELTDSLGIVPITGVVREKTANLVYAQTYSRLRPQLRLTRSELDYDGTGADRNISAAALSVGYAHSSDVRSNLGLARTETDFLQPERNDTETSIAYTLRYQLSRKLSGEFGLRTSREESSDVAANYDESSVLLRLSYSANL